MKITLDLSPIIYGSRAIKRCTLCMTKELLKNEKIYLKFFYIDYRKRKNKYFKPIDPNFEESIVRVPYKLLVPLWKLLAWPAYNKILSEYDIFYTNDFYFPPNKKTMILATVHGIAYKAIPELFPPRIVRSLNQGFSYMVKHADYLVAVSETTKRDLIRYANVNPERIYVVTHGVDKQFRMLANKEEVWDRLKTLYGLNQVYILYVGAIGIHKNIMSILSAFELLSHEFPHHLVLAGSPDSAWEGAKRFVAEKNISTRVHFLGHVYDTEKLVDLYNGTDLFVFPSFYEGWTSPPLESMACGAPVITSNCSSLPETTGEAAVQVNPHSIQELFEQMKRILADKAVQEMMIAKGFEHVSSHTWDKAAEKLVKVFEDILAKGPWVDKKT